MINAKIEYAKIKYFASVTPLFQIFFSVRIMISSDSEVSSEITILPTRKNFFSREE
jgi:hypothetical protein